MNWILIVGLGVASALDGRFRRIPNVLTFALGVTGMIFETFHGGFQGFTHSLLGASVGVALLYLPFLLGGMGGGDVKLLGSLGAFVGPVAVIKIFLAAAVFGGFFSLVEIIRKRAWRTTFQNLKNRGLHFLLTREWGPESPTRFSAEPLRIPYAVTIGCGYLWILVFGGK